MLLGTTLFIDLQYPPFSQIVILPLSPESITIALYDRKSAFFKVCVLSFQFNDIGDIYRTKK